MAYGVRGLGSESSTWSALAVISALQYSFTFVPPPGLGWLAVLSIGFAVTLGVVAMGVALTSFESLPKRIVAILISLVLLTISLGHLARPAPAVNIAEPVARPTASPTPDYYAEDTPYEAGSSTPRPGFTDTPTRPFTVSVPGIEVEARISGTENDVYRLTWRLSRDGVSKLCGPVFLRGTRQRAEETMQIKIDASTSRSSLGTLACD